MATEIEVFPPVLRELTRCRAAGCSLRWPHRPDRQGGSGAGNDNAHWLGRRAADTVRHWIAHIPSGEKRDLVIATG